MGWVMVGILPREDGEVMCCDARICRSQLVGEAADAVYQWGRFANKFTPTGGGGYIDEFLENASLRNAFMSAHELMSASLL